MFELDIFYLFHANDKLVIAYFLVQYEIKSENIRNSENIRHTALGTMR